MPAASQQRIIANKLTEGLKELEKVIGLEESRIQELFAQNLERIKPDLIGHLLGEAELVRVVNELPNGAEAVGPAVAMRKEMKLALTLAKARLPIMLTGPAGSGKSTMAKQLAEILGLDFGSITMFDGMEAGPLVGWLYPGGTNGQWRYQPSQHVNIVKNGGVYLYDEVDAADANTAIILNNLLGLRYLDTPLNSEAPTVHAHKDYFPIMACNTLGTGSSGMYTGRNALDKSTLDRVCCSKIVVDYDKQLELSFAGEDQKCKVLVAWAHKVRNVLNNYKIQELITTRFIKNACALIRGGMEVRQVQELYFTGWESSTRKRVEEAM